MGGNSLWVNMIILVVFAVLMYFLLIKPQKKKEKQINDMRNSITVGDEIVTIGGICGKVVKTKTDSIIIQVGADKTKFEMKKWCISSVEKKSDRRYEEAPVEEQGKVKPKRLEKKKSADNMESELDQLKSSMGEVSETAEESTEI